MDNHFNHYALQQNLYAAILRRRYEMHVSSMALVQIHPELTGYKVVDVPEWRELADNLLNAAGDRMNTVMCGEGRSCCVVSITGENQVRRCCR